MIRTYTPFQKYWNSFIAILTLYRIAEIPLHTALDYRTSAVAGVLDLICCLVFLVDIVMRFRAPYMDRGRLVYDVRRAARQYLCGWFIFDLLGSVPFVFFSYAGLPICEVWQWTALARLLRLGEFTHNLLIRQTSSFLWRRIAVFLFWGALIVHLFACGWIILGGVEVQDKASAYLQSCYWAITTLSTTGYGDIVPETDTQRIFAMMAMLAGTGIYATIIANIASIITRMDSVRAAYQEKTEKLHTFMRYKKVPPALEKQIVNYYSYAWEKGLGYDESKILSELPPSLRQSLLFHLNKDLLEKVPFFKNARHEVIEKLITYMRSQIFMPGDFIFKRGEVGGSMYFINHGKVEILGADESILAILDEGDFFGEVALLTNQPRNASVQALEFCTLYSLDRQALDLVLKEFPDFARQIKAVAEERK